MVTVALAPARSGLLGSGGLVILIRTGKRCVTLTQFPVAFSGGSTEKIWPDPGLMLSTVPSKVTPVYMSILMVAFWPGLMRPRYVSLNFDSNHHLQLPT